MAVMAARMTKVELRVLELFRGEIEAVHTKHMIEVCGIRDMLLRNFSDLRDSLITMAHQQHRPVAYLQGGQADRIDALCHQVQRFIHDRTADKQPPEKPTKRPAKKTKRSKR
jgi:hypothetical protein